MAENDNENEIVMQGDSIVALFGEIGAGKTNRLVEQLLEELKRGSYCLWVNTKTQTLDVEAVASYLGDDSVHHRLVCITSEDILKPGFWPEERHALSTRWKDSVFRAGTRMFWDEAWDLLDANVEIEIPDPKKAGEVKHEKFLKTDSGRKVKLMLRKMRHWKGPADYRDPKTLVAIADDTWSPQRSEAESDGIPMISCGVMFATQQYMALDLEIRRSVQAILFLRTYGDSFKGKLFGVLANKYREVYVRGNQAPKKIDALDKDPNKVWIIRPHIPEVHALTTKVRGSERSMVSRIAGNPRSPLAYVRAIGFLLFCAVMIYCIGSLVYSFVFKSDDPKPETSVSSSEKPSEKPSESSTGKDPSPSAGSSSVRIVGRVGSQIMLNDGTRTWFVDSAGYVKSEVGGYVGKYDGSEVSSWSAPLVSSSRDESGDRPGEKPPAAPGIF